MTERLRFGAAETMECVHGNALAQCKKGHQEILHEAHEFEHDAEKERVIDETAQKIIGRIRDTVTGMFGDMSALDSDSDKRRLFISKMKEAWPEHHKSKGRWVFEVGAMVEECRNIVIRFETMRSRGGGLQRGSSDELRRLSIRIGNILESKDETELLEHLTDLEETVVHESVHIYYDEGHDVYSTQTYEEQIEYFAQPGELRAYAKMFAYRYAKKFPGEKFSLDKMKLILDDASEANYAEKYFVQFADPAMQQKYTHIADLGYLHDTIINLTSRYVDRFLATSSDF